MKLSYFSKDIQEFLNLLYKHQVKYVIVGGEAVIFYGYVRLTGDIDIFFEASPKNVKRLYEALTEFWEGTIPGLQWQEELFKPGVIIQFGVPPNRIDLINKIEEVTFNEAWEGKVTDTIRLKTRTFTIYFIGLNQLIKNKESLKRPKDMEDLKYLKKRKELNNL